MPRGQNLDHARQPREERARLLGVKLLEPGEVSVSVRVRGEASALEVFLSLSAEERGEVVKAGLEALGKEYGEDGGNSAGENSAAP